MRSAMIEIKVLKNKIKFDVNKLDSPFEMSDCLQSLRRYEAFSGFSSKVGDSNSTSGVSNEKSGSSLETKG